MECIIPNTNNFYHDHSLNLVTGFYCVWNKIFYHLLCTSNDIKCFMSRAKLKQPYNAILPYDFTIEFKKKISNLRWCNDCWWPVSRHITELSIVDFWRWLLSAITKDKYKLLQSLISLVEIDENQYTCHSGYGGLPALRFPVAPIAACILSSNAGERGPRANAKRGN